MSDSTTKRCAKCGAEKPLTDYYIRPGSSDGYRHECKQCKSERDHANVLARHTAPTPCTDCGGVFPFEQLTKRWRRCAACAKAHEKAMEAAYKQRPEIKQRESAWMRQNRAADPIRAREQTRLTMRKQRATVEGAARARAANHRWRERNPEKVQAHNKRIKAIRKQVPGAHSLAEWQALKAHYDHRCLRCGKCEPEIVLTEDHVIPVSKGGSNDISNIQPLCLACNCSKGNRHTTDYR